MKNKLLRALVFAGMMATATIANASVIVIDFNANVFNNASVDNLLPNPYVENGFKITTVGRPLSVAGTASTDWLGNPSAHLRVANGNIDVEMALMTGSVFDLLSIDLSILNPNGVSPLVTFQAFNSSNVLVGTQSFLPTMFGLQTVIFGSSFGNITRVRWQQGTGELTAHQFDNIHIQVPEPSTLALLGAGLLGFSFMRRKRVA